MGVFRNRFACESWEQYDGGYGGGDADRKHDKFSGTIADVSGSDCFKFCLTRATKLAEKQETGQTSDNTRYHVGSKRNSRQAIQIVCQTERNRAETQQDHDFPPLLFYRRIDGAKCRVFPQPAGYVIAQEPSGQAEPARRAQCDAGERSQDT